jgi:adenine-specific DNA methylase
MTNEDDNTNLEKSKHLQEFLKKVDAEQHNGPFNYRDSDMVEELRTKLEKGAIDYDDEPVTACPVCSGLYLKDIDGQLECFTCGNEIREEDVVVYGSIYKYLEAKTDEEC